MVFSGITDKYVIFLEITGGRVYHFEQYDGQRICYCLFVPFARSTKEDEGQETMLGYLGCSPRRPAHAVVTSKLLEEETTER